jgi:hypothetical protein
VTQQHLKHSYVQAWATQTMTGKLHRCCWDINLRLWAVVNHKNVGFWIKERTDIFYEMSEWCWKEWEPPHHQNPIKGLLLCNNVVFVLCWNWTLTCNEKNKKKNVSISVNV